MVKFERSITAKTSFRQKLYNILFDSDTKGGKAFNIFLISAIIISICVVMLDSIESVHKGHGSLLHSIEWFFTIVFTVEYLLRIISSRRPGQYIGSFYGVVDVLSFMPTYLGVFFLAFEAFFVLRILRLLRLFRIFKMVRFVEESSILFNAIKSSARKILIFIYGVIILIIITGAVMYIIEGPEHGFTSIPLSIYWSISTLSTVGFGDIYPVTALGKFFAGLLMIISYALLAVPTGIVTLELSKASKHSEDERFCSCCKKLIYDKDAKHCKCCGKKL